MATKIRCLICNKVIESKGRCHNFVECGCENKAFVDGGDAYGRIGAVDLSKIVLVKEDGTEEPIKY